MRKNKNRDKLKEYRKENGNRQDRLVKSVKKYKK